MKTFPIQSLSGCTPKMSCHREARPAGRGDPDKFQMDCFVPAEGRRLAMTFLKYALVATLLGVMGSAARAASGTALPTSDAKKLGERYALTKTRIQELLGARLHPVALPATALPNPFYRSTVGPEVPQQNPEVPVQPDAPDLTDVDTLTKYAAGLKLSGYLILNEVPHVSINGAPFKTGDVITLGPKDHPVFLHIDALNPQEITLRLNETKLVVPLKK